VVGQQEQELEGLARAGADSVYGYVARTAEAGPDGVRWRTLSFQDVPHYGANLYNGVAGVALFLADYARLRDVPAAGALARRALDWCAVPGRALRHPDDHPGASDASLAFGHPGIGLAWLRLARATADPALLAPAAAVGARLLAAEPGPQTSLLFGAAGAGWFLLRLWAAAGDERYLAGAVAHGAWLERVAERDRAGCRWPGTVGGPRPPRPGFGIGTAGTGASLLELFRATGAARWAALAREVAAALTGQARRDGAGLSWPAVFGGGGPEPPGAPAARRWRWCTGAPGIGLFYARAAEVLGAGGLSATAAAAGEGAWAHGDALDNPSQCHGLAGAAELFLELHRLTGRPVWRERAGAVARRAFASRTRTAEGDVWPADTPGLSSPDLMCGAAGVGHFFLRLLAPERVPRVFA
jgi:lantibiotic modifying enzyme